MNSSPWSSLLPCFVEGRGYDKKALGLRIWMSHLWQKKSALFGAEYTIQEYVRGNQSQPQAVVETVLECTYLDNSMDSTVDEKSFIGLYHHLWELLAKAGMHAQKWLSTSTNVMKEIRQKDLKGTQTCLGWRVYIGKQIFPNRPSIHKKKFLEERGYSVWSSWSGDALHYQSQDSATSHVDYNFMATLRSS